MVILTPLLTQFLQTTEIPAFINTYIINAIYDLFGTHPATNGVQDVIVSMGLPEFLTTQLVNQVDLFSGTEDIIAASIAGILSDMILKASISMFLFVVLKILLALFSKALEGFLAIPAIDHLDKAAGFIMGAMNALLIIYISCGLLTIFIPLDKIQMFNEFVLNTYIFRYFYENNYLLNLFI